MNWKKYIPDIPEVVKITVVVVGITVTGALAYLIGTANKLKKKIK